PCPSSRRGRRCGPRGDVRGDGGRSRLRGVRAWTERRPRGASPQGAHAPSRQDVQNVHVVRFVRVAVDERASSRPRPPPPLPRPRAAWHSAPVKEPNRKVFDEIEKLATEQRNPRTMDLDRLDTRAVLERINGEDRTVADIVRE